MMILDSLPDEVLASLEIRNAAWRRMAENAPGLEFVASDLARWVPGSVVRVAFLDGDTDLHDAVAGATDQITEACNLRLDFGSDGSGGYRRWREDDEDYAAEIRVSFDLGGYFSLVGTDSTDRSIGLPGEPVGGRPNQRSLNLSGFAAQRPDRWEGTVRHEFLHALAFHHSHQNLRGPCEVEFRWDDDPGYVPTRDPRGVFVPDSQGRRPGIYTFLAGPPNRWPRHKVDHNLRTEDDPAVVVGPFDPASVMLYRFPSFFYKSDPSRCAPTGNGVDLSGGDKRGLSLLYPHDAEGLSLLHSRAAALQGTLQTAAEPVRESLPEQDGVYRDRALTLLSGLAGENV
ncbi:hypothetical protein [Kocuria sp. LHG3120]|uniref:hypothetical protein n=1 Tax=Kocuria sp. LHG3120 TaxID=2804590 RepID=UPI003CE6ABFE